MIKQNEIWDYCGYKGKIDKVVPLKVVERLKKEIKTEIFRWVRNHNNWNEREIYEIVDSVFEVEKK